MTNEEDCDGLVVDRLVREYVERTSAEVDATALIARVCSERASRPAADRATVAAARPSERTTVRSWRRAATWWGATTLAVAAAFLCGRQFNIETANAASVLREVQTEHARAVDYCYRVQFDPDPRFWNPKNKLEGPSLSRLWTRGDRFWSDCAIGDLKFQVGREASGAIWISSSPDRGIRFSNHAEDLPKTVAQLCQINSMSVPRLMNEVLVDFDLTSSTKGDAVLGERTLVWAQLKPGRSHPLLRYALLEIDPRANNLVRLVLWTVHERTPRGTVTFTLLESAQLPDDQYELAAHVVPTASIDVQTLANPDYQPDLKANP